MWTLRVLKCLPLFVINSSWVFADFEWLVRFNDLCSTLDQGINRNHLVVLVVVVVKQSFSHRVLWESFRGFLEERTGADRSTTQVNEVWNDTWTISHASPRWHLELPLHMRGYSFSAPASGNVLAHHFPSRISSISPRIDMTQVSWLVKSDMRWCRVLSGS